MCAQSQKQNVHVDGVWTDLTVSATSVPCNVQQARTGSQVAESGSSSIPKYRKGDADGSQHRWLDVKLGRCAAHES